MFNGHLVYLVVIWYIFHSIGVLYQEKSGNPAQSAWRDNKKPSLVRFFPFPATNQPKLA
jgi:hypothetical protein